MSHSRQLVSLPVSNASPFSPMWSAQFAALIDLQQPYLFNDPAPPRTHLPNTSKHLRVCMGSCKKGSGVEANPTSGQRRCSWVLGSSRLFRFVQPQYLPHAVPQSCHSFYMTTDPRWRFKRRSDKTTRTGCTQRRRWCNSRAEWSESEMVELFNMDLSPKLVPM